MGETSIEIRCPLFIWAVCLFVVEFLPFLKGDVLRGPLFAGNVLFSDVVVVTVVRSFWGPRVPLSERRLGASSEHVSSLWLPC